MTSDADQAAPDAEPASAEVPAEPARAARRPVARLKRRPDFLAAARGRRFHTERMTVQGRARDEAADGPDRAVPGLRVGFTVTKRVGHAPERNRIRRRLRVAVEAALGAAIEVTIAASAALDADRPRADMPVDAGSIGARPIDVVVVARREALAAPFPLLVEDLARALAAVTRPGSRGGRNEGRHGPKPRRRGAPDPAPPGPTAHPASNQGDAPLR